MRKYRSVQHYLIYTVVFLFTIVSFAQTVTINHPGNLSSNWIRNPRSSETNYMICYTDILPNSKTEEELVSELFMIYLNIGGVTINAAGAAPSSFYSSYVNQFEYDEFLEASRVLIARGERTQKMEDYYWSKYPNDLAPYIQEGKINNYRTLFFYLDESDGQGTSQKRTYRYFVFLNDDYGVIINASAKYVEDESELAFSQYQDMLFRHVQQLEFTLTDGPPPEITNDPPDDNNVIWKVIIGAIVAGGGIGLVKGLRKKKPKAQPAKTKKQPSRTEDKKEDKKENKKKTRYYLQINKSEFDLLPDEPQALEVKVWKEFNGQKRVVSANIRVHNNERSLKIMPFSTIGTLNSTLNLVGEPSKEEFNIKVVATADRHTYQSEILIKTGRENKLLVKTLPNNRRSIRPNLDLQLECRAKVVDAAGRDLPDLTKEITFKSRSDWLDLSQAVEIDGWKAINIEAQDPNANAAVSHPPESAIVSVLMEKVPENEPIMQEDVEIKLLDCKIDTSVDTHDLNFTASGEKTEINFDAFIEGCDGGEPWNFEASYQTDDGEPDTPLSSISLSKVSEGKAKITLTGPDLLPSEDEQSLQKKLVVSAQQKDEEPLERHLYVYVSHEGLFITKGVDKKGEIAFLAKGEIEKELEFSCHYLDKNTNKLEVDAAALRQLDFELQGDKLAHKNIDEALQTEFTFDSLVTTIPRARYFYRAPKNLPGFGDVHELIYKVSAPVTNTERPEAFEKFIKLKVQTYGIGEKFPEWREAYKNCIKAIYLVPESHQRQQLLDLLEKHKYKMDIEGMVEFRRRIWSTAHDLLINKRDGYLAIANWHDAIIDTLEWVVWMGDIAFQVVVSTYTGPFGGFAASSFKETALTGYRMAIEGRSVKEYVDEQLETYKNMVFSAAKGQIVSTRMIEKFYKGSKIKVWAIYAVATFAMAYQRLGSVPEAARFTARQLRDEAIIRFLSGQVKMQMDAAKAAKNAKPKVQSKRVKEALKNLEKEVRTNRIGGKFMDKAKVLEIMKDPALVRTIKEHGSLALKKAFDGPRKKIYQIHDRNLKQQLAKQEGISEKDLMVDDFRTPGTKGYNLNTDRDYRVLRRYKMANGKEVWLEVPREKWLGKSYKEIGKLTGKPANMTDLEWAEQLQQRGTDKYDAEACADYSDHAWDPVTGKMIRVRSNIQNVVEGKGTLLDPDDIGRMYRQKVINAGKSPEAFAQAKKGVKSLKAVRKGYQKQGYKLKKLDKDLEAAMRVIENQKVTVDATPEDLAITNKALKHLNFEGGVDEVMQKISTEFSSLKDTPKPTMTQRMTAFMFD